MYTEDADTITADRPGGQAPEAGTREPAETWILQGEAAARTGFSVSAIRKWRRMGLVAERKISTGSDLPRVEVKLEDVLARAALQPQRRPLPAVEPEAAVQTPPGCLIIGIADLEELFDRMVRAERRAELAEAELQAMEVQTRYTLGQMAELRRQLAVSAGRPTHGEEPAPAVVPARAPKAAPAIGPAVRPTPPERPATPVDTGTRTRADTGTGSSTVRRAPASVIRVPQRPAVRPVPPRPPAAPALRPSDAPTEVERLVQRLRTIYARLDEYRGEATISPSREARRQRELAEYDAALVAVCAALGMPTGLEPGAPVSVDARARLTRGLARAGLDVRATGAPAARPRTRWPSPRPRI
jgi:hypothetical protein